MLYQITDGSISAGGTPVLSHFNFEIKGNEKVALVGRNGTRENNAAAADCRRAGAGSR